jgi:hypothetical protein
MRLRRGPVVRPCRVRGARVRSPGARPVPPARQRVPRRPVVGPRIRLRRAVVRRGGAVRVGRVAGRRVAARTTPPPVVARATRMRRAVPRQGAVSRAGPYRWVTRLQPGPGRWVVVPLVRSVPGRLVRCRWVRPRSGVARPILLRPGRGRSAAGRVPRGGGVRPVALRSAWSRPVLDRAMRLHPGPGLWAAVRVVPWVPLRSGAGWPVGMPPVVPVRWAPWQSAAGPTRLHRGPAR